MEPHAVVSREEWIAARKAHLVRALPWVRVDKPYVFEGAQGRQTLADLFEGRRQLIVQHFMVDPSWDEGCKSCSFWADNFDGLAVHLEHRDVSLVLVSRAPFETLRAYQARMGWRLPWVSSLHTDFNRDFHVTFTDEERAAGRAWYNYELRSFPVGEAPGVSVFARDDHGGIFHTDSCYARRLDMLNSAYHLLDLVPRGRDEDGLVHTMDWLRHHDRYEPRPVPVTGGIRTPPAGPDQAGRRPATPSAG